MGTNYIASNWRIPTNQNSSKNDNYSLSFQPSGPDTIDLGTSSILELRDDFSISVWIKETSSLNRGIFCCGDRSGTSGWMIYRTSANKVAFSVYTANNRIATSTTSINTGDWFHVVATFERAGTANQQIKIYVNTVPEGQNGWGTTLKPSYSGTIYKEISYPYLNLSGREFDGNISEAAVFDYLLTQDQINTLYGEATLGAGNPMALKPTPIGYWPLGDNSASGPLAQPNVAVNDASVFDFIPASTQYLQLPTSTFVYAAEFTLSVWVNPSILSSSQVVFGNGSSSNNWLRLSSATGIGFKIDSNLQNFTEGSGNDLVVDTWQHLLITRDSSNDVTIYRNGEIFGAATNYTQTLTISSIGYRGLLHYDGELSNIALWNSDQSANATTIYNSGVPGDLSSLNPTAWYKLDQSANWEADTVGAWQIPDAVSAYPKSFSFNGVDDVITVPTTSFDMTNDLTLSCWINLGTLTTWDYLCTRGSTAGTNSALNWRFSSTGVLFSTYLGGSINTGVSFTTGGTTWHHLAITYDYSSGDVLIYKDGEQTGNTLTFANGYPTAILQSIGAINGTGSSSINAKISNFAIWESIQDISELYNNGTPATSYTNTPAGWWKLDQSANWDVGGSGNWTIPDASGNGNDGTSTNMTEQSLVNNNVSVLNGESSGMTSGNLVLSDLTRNLPYENYSLQFDGTADYINHGNVTGLNNAPNASWSFWMNPLATGFRYMFSAYGTTGPNQQIYFAKKGTGVEIRLRGEGYVGGTPVMFNESSQSWTLGSWYHIAVTFDGAESDNAQKVKVYVNGNPLTNTSVGAAITNINTTTENFYIALLGGYTTNEFGGNISNMAIWNNTLSSTEIQNLYANGMPQDLTTFTPQPINWWTLGKESFWDGADWVVRDMIGTNDGLSDNMGGNELKGDAPRSQANGVGTNIAVPTDLEGNAGWSDKNGYSINMGPLARTTDTP